jgi:hypothetical protein
MSKERITIFLFTFIVIFTIATGYIYGSISPDPTEEVVKKDLGFWGVMHGLKNFTVDIPLISGGIITIVAGLGVYIVYREARGGL